MVAAAVVGSAVIGAVGSAASANAQSSAAKKAAAAQTAAAEGTNALDLAIYNDNRDLLEPGITSGASARARQMLMQGFSRDEVKDYLRSINAAVNSPGPQLNDGRGTPLSRYQATRGISGGAGGFVGSTVTSSPTVLSTPNGSMKSNSLSETDLVGYQGGAAEQAYRNANAETPYTGAELAAMGEEERAAALAASNANDDFAWVDDWEWQPNSPSYQFRFDQGAEALNRNLAARGLYSSGAAAKRLTEYGQDFGSQEFEADYNRFGALAGQGQQNTGTVVNVASQAGQSIGNNMRYGADARASGYYNAGNAQAAGYRGAANAAIGGINAYGAYNGWWDNPESGGWT